MEHSNSLIFILPDTVLLIILLIIFSRMEVSEMIRFLQYDHPTLYGELSQFHFTQRDKHPTLDPKNIVRTL